jgi:hypothetical protein
MGINKCTDTEIDCDLGFEREDNEGLGFLSQERSPSHGVVDDPIKEALEVLDRIRTRVSVQTSGVPENTSATSNYAGHHAMPDAGGSNMLITRPTAASEQRTTPFSMKGSRVSKLFFVLADWELGQFNPFPSEHIFQIPSLREFFALVCEKSSRSQLDVDQLSLQYNWGQRHSLTVSASMSEDEWRRLKNIVKDRFIMTRDDYPGLEEFHVWVKCPLLADD